MAKFEITFERVVVQTDRFTRIVEADTMEAAIERAEAACSLYDNDCPDDAAPFGGDECQSWEIHDASGAPDDAEVDDLPSDDGECRTCAEAIETRVAPCDECGALDGEIDD